MNSGLKQAIWATTVTVIAAAFTMNAFAQDMQTDVDTAYVPFVVNVDAAITAEPIDGTILPTYPQVSATANEKAILRIPLSRTNSVRNGAQRQTTVPTIISNRNGKVAVNLSAQSYKNAEVSLYTVNGKRILRQKVSVSSVTNNISHQNVAIGVYLLSVRGTDGTAITSRITHNGGGLDINVVFGGENKISDPNGYLTKKADVVDWRIIITAVPTRYIDSVYTFRPTAGTNNPQQDIILREVPLGTYLVRISSIGTGATSSNYCLPGTRVNIAAGTAPTGQRFRNWMVESGGIIFADANSAATSFIMPENTVAVTANFEAIPVNAVRIISEAADAVGAGSYAAGTTVNITAGTTPIGRRFKMWATESEGVVFANANNAATSFVMPENAVEVTAGFEANTFKVIVSSVGTGATGGGDYLPGATVSISAGTIPASYQFKNWTSSNSDVIFANANDDTTTFIMPGATVTVTANVDGYKTVTISSKIWMAESKHKDR